MQECRDERECAKQEGVGAGCGRVAGGEGGYEVGLICGECKLLPWWIERFMEGSCTLFIHTLFYGIFVVGFGGVLECFTEARGCHLWVEAVEFACENCSWGWDVYCSPGRV
jgi:hypothetical protein